MFTFIDCFARADSRFPLAEFFNVGCGVKKREKKKQPRVSNWGVFVGG